LQTYGELDFANSKRIPICRSSERQLYNTELDATTSGVPGFLWLEESNF